MTELAVVTWPDDEFYFVSDDGDHFYEVHPRPRSSADLEHLRPLGVAVGKDGEQMSRINFARRWLARLGTDPDKTTTFESLF